MATTEWRCWRRGSGNLHGTRRPVPNRRRRFRPGLEELEARQVPTFLPAVPLLTGGAPAGVATADLNGDGTRDLVVTCLDGFGKGSVKVFLGNGAGRFQAPKSFPAGDTPGAVAVGDFDGDGKRDLVVADSQSAALVFFGHGDGTFDTPLTFPLPLNATGVAVADFNGDHRDDFAMTVTGDFTLRVFLNTGGHNFSMATYHVPGGTDSVVVGYLNHDDKPDLAVTTIETNEVAVLLNNGSGSFLAPSYFSVGATPYSVAVGDVNGDGKPDLVTANNDLVNYEHGTISVLLGSGTGGFAAPRQFPAGTNPDAVLVGNFTGNTFLNLATPDVVVVNPNNNSVSLLAGDGAGHFAAPVPFPVGNFPNAMAAADFNGDFRLDLVTASVFDNTVSVLFGAPDRVSLPPVAVPQQPAVQDVTAQVALRRGRWSGPGSRRHLQLTLRNLSADPLVNLKVVLQPLGPQGTLWNAGGISQTVAPGEPFVTVPISVLNPGQSVRLPLVFRAKRKVPFEVLVVEDVATL